MLNDQRGRIGRSSLSINVQAEQWSRPRITLSLTIRQSEYPSVMHFQLSLNTTSHWRIKVVRTAKHFQKSHVRPLCLFQAHSNVSGRKQFKYDVNYPDLPYYTMRMELAVLFRRRVVMCTMSTEMFASKDDKSIKKVAFKSLNQRVKWQWNFYPVMGAFGSRHYYFIYHFHAKQHSLGHVYMFSEFLLFLFHSCLSEMHMKKRRKCCFYIFMFIENVFSLWQCFTGHRSRVIWSNW